MGLKQVEDDDTEYAKRTQEYLRSARIRGLRIIAAGSRAFATQAEPGR